MPKVQAHIVMGKAVKNPPPLVYHHKTSSAERLLHTKDPQLKPHHLKLEERVKQH